MKRFLPVVLSGVLAASSSQMALAQDVNVQGPADTGATVDLEKQTLPDTNVQNSQQVGDQSSAGSGASSDDKNPDSPGKGWAKGHERGKGHGVNDERHGGRHGGSGDGSTTQKQESEGKY